MNLFNYLATYPEKKTLLAKDILAELSQVIVPAVTVWSQFSDGAQLPTERDIEDVLRIIDGRNYADDFRKNVIDPLIGSGLTRAEIKAALSRRS